ncbi:hypothetical protein DM860_017998 [Cuscuta australis]|uniref:Reverse transcriptase zinc-binding domain-containing protein n=1 Tax=Cuscuta australis TaxID=267555 RepID=A0A328E1P9_9ASTE|nr:hypothetical protein DM860_017998 [Cuscuta australis]
MGGFLYLATSFWEYGFRLAPAGVCFEQLVFGWLGIQPEGYGFSSDSSATLSAGFLLTLSVSRQGRLLNHSGRLILLKHNLNSIPLHTLAVNKLPKSIIHLLHNKMCTFLWGHTEGKDSYHWASWDRICLTEDKGGEEDQEAFFRNRQITFKEAYLAIQPEEEEEDAEPLQHMEIIWNMKQIPKVSFFQWRLHQKLLPFPAHLRKFGITSLPSICHLCKRDNDTDYHALFQCPYAKPIWSYFEWIFKIPWQATHGVRAYLHKWWTEYHNQTLEGWLKGIIPGIISHQIWKERNRRIHENSSKESGRLLQDCIAQVPEWVLGRAPSKLKYFDAWRLPPELMLSQQRNPSLRVHRWTNTSDSGLHLSTDVATNQNYGVASAVLRRGNGTFIAAGTWKIEETSALQGEAKALAIGIQWAAHFGRYIWANTDCKSLAKSISSRKNPGISHELWTTLPHAFSHSGQKISYIPREGNMGAHHLAKWASQHNLFTPCISFLIAPPHVQGAITADVMLPFFR